MSRVTWRGVFPALCTQFHADLSLDIPGTLAVELSSNAGQPPLSTYITALHSPDGFTVGVDLNEINKKYNYMALSATALFLALRLQRSL